MDLIMRLDQSFAQGLCFFFGGGGGWDFGLMANSLGLKAFGICAVKPRGLGVHAYPCSCRIHTMKAE